MDFQHVGHILLNKCRFMSFFILRRKRRLTRAYGLCVFFILFPTSKALSCYFQSVCFETVCQTVQNTDASCPLLDFVCVLSILGCLRVNLWANNSSSLDIHVAPQGSKDLISTERYKPFLFLLSIPVLISFSEDSKQMSRRCGNAEVSR